MFKQFIFDVLIFAIPVAIAISLYDSNHKAANIISYVFIFISIWFSITFVKKMRIYLALLMFRIKRGYWCDDPIEFREMMFDLNEKKIRKQLKTSLNINYEKPISYIFKTILKVLVFLGISVTIFMYMHSSEEKLIQVIGYIFVLPSVIGSLFILITSILNMILLISTDFKEDNK